MKQPYFLKNLILVLTFFISTIHAFSQNQNTNITWVDVDWDVCQYHPTSYSHKSYIQAPAQVFQKNAQGSSCGNFIVNYNGFTPDAEAAFQFAVDIWAASIVTTIPIRVSANFGPLGPGVLGGAGPGGFVTVPTSGFPANTVFPLALAEQLTNQEIMDGSLPSTDIIATFSSTANFYFGLDGNTPGGQVDFVSVVLHELGHGLGMLGFARVDDETTPTEGLLRNSGFVNVWDQFIENGTPADITSFTDPSAALLSEFTGNNLFCNGPIAMAQNGNVKPSTYAPFSFSTGSSYSHWDENTYPPGDLNSLMTPFISPGEAIHSPGLVTLGFMEDMGWSICGGTLKVNDFNVNSLKISPNPFTSSVSISLPEGMGENFQIEIIDMNGRTIKSVEKTTKNNSIELSNLDELDSAIYFMKIMDVDAGISVTKKLIKN